MSKKIVAETVRAIVLESYNRKEGKQKARERVIALLKDLDLPDDEKKILLTLPEHVYVWAESWERLNDRNLSYVLREKNKINHILKSALIKIIIKYVGEGENLKKMYIQFKKDFSNYAIDLELIAEMCVTKDSEVKLIIQQRISEAQKLYNKYPEFLEQPELLKSILEYDLWTDKLLKIA
ncbi:MAG: hypothetical protein H0Z24_03065 [Thermosipho sp. (in: Bacteria)]|nr:hypothetical protein [Thermosipho sp. (in: thermotogales)]